MKAMNRSRRAQSGLSMAELLIAVTLGLMLMAGLAALFASTSANRTELERNARQIENGRFAMEILSEDLRLAGFYGEQPIGPNALPTDSDPCTIDPLKWKAQMPISVQHYDKGVGVPVCITGLATIKADTDVIVIRRVSTCEAGVGECDVAVAGKPYIQVSKCATETPLTPFLLNKMGGPAFNLKNRDCNTPARLRRYMVRVYFISTENGNGVAMPTLMRAEFNGTGFDVSPMVEGIEELNVEYGMDFQGQAFTPGPDGQPDAFTANPTGFTEAVCTAAVNCPAASLANATTARITLLARNLEPSANYTDTKTYNMGRDSGGLDVLITPGGPHRRHAYTGVVRIVNVAERRERPL